MAGTSELLNCEIECNKLCMAGRPRANQAAIVATDKIMNVHNVQEIWTFFNYFRLGLGDLTQTLNPNLSQ